MKLHLFQQIVELNQSFDRLIQGLERLESVLSGQVKTGHMWSLQNRPYVARDLDLVPRLSLLGQA